MSARGLLWIAGANLRADRRGALLNAAAACVGAAALVFFLALGLGVREAVGRMFPADARLVEIVPSSVSLGGSSAAAGSTTARWRGSRRSPAPRRPGRGSRSGSR